MMFARVAILGVGLLGGSLGLEIKRLRLAKEIVGCGRSKKNLRVALRRRAIDAATNDPLKAVMGADLVILAAPVGTIISHLKSIGPHLKAGALVMDVGSTKEEILKASKSLPRSVGFVGAHPIAGTENAGAASAVAGLFRGKKCLLTSRRGTDRRYVNRATAFWKKLGSQVSFVPASSHDRALGVVSHLPHLAAYALMATIRGELPEKKIRSLAGGGLMDTTRIAASPAEMWTDIALSNRRNLLKILGSFSRQISRIERFIAGKKRGELLRFLQRQSRLRSRLSS